MKKGWIHNAAIELASHFSFGSGRDNYVTDEQRQNVANHYADIIVKWCPMKPDTAYMEVPRCDTCQYLRRAEAHDDRGACDHLQLWVSIDFGCVAWKAK